MIDVLETIGVFVFALSGAALAARHRLDIIGALTLATVTGLAGGVMRDVLLGETPPTALREQHLLLVPIVATAVVVVTPRLVGHIRRPVILFDSIGLALFAVVGSTKASEAGVGPASATLIGALSAVGGGLIRDVFVQRTPIVFTPDSGLYVIPAGLGALTVALGHRYLSTASADDLALLSGGAAVCIVIVRLSSIRFGWSTPRLSPTTDIDHL